MPAGRPVTFTPEIIAEVIDKMDAYIDSHDVPVVAEFAYQNNIRKATLYEIPELAYSLKRLTEKKEANLEIGGLSNKVNTSMAIFSLKQMGWRDKHEMEHSGGIKLEVEFVQDSDK